MNCSIMMYNDRPSFTIMPGFICESAVARWHNQHESSCAPVDVACSTSGVGWLVQHVENGLLEIFLLVCGSSAQAPSCWRERRRQMSCAAAAGGLAEWPRA